MLPLDSQDPRTSLPVGPALLCLLQTVFLASEGLSLTFPSLPTTRRYQLLYYVPVILQSALCAFFFF